MQKKTPRHLARVLSVIFLDSLGFDEYSDKNLYCNKYPTLFKKSTNVADHAEINYLPMFQCILGQLDVISRDSPDFAAKMFNGVFFIADYKNQHKKLKKISITWSK